jgi:HK97 gp10 family phage protein
MSGFEVVSIDIDETGIAALRHDPAVRDALLEAGGAVADVARTIAPRWAGGSHGGAESIHDSHGEDAHGYYVEVSWDAAHSYMRFPNSGTRYQRAQRFMEYALEVVLGGGFG